MTAEHTGKSRTSAPILRLIVELSKPSKDQNIIWHFQKAFKRVKKIFKIGIGSYLLKIIHNSIRTRKGIVQFKSIHEPPLILDFISKGSRTGQKAYLMVMLKAKAMGFEAGNPHYFKKMRVHLDEFRKAQRKINVKGSFKAARKACLSEARMTHYKGFQQKLDAKRAAKESKRNSLLVRGALKKISKAKALRTKPTKGVTGAKATLKKTGVLSVASNALISARAKRRADAWAHKYGRCGSIAEMLDLAPRIKPKALAAPAKTKAIKQKGHVKTLQTSKETQAKVARAKAVRKAALRMAQMAKSKFLNFNEKVKKKKARSLERKGKMMKADVLRKTLAKERRLKTQKRQKQAKEKKAKAAKLLELVQKAKVAKAAAAEKKKKHASREKTAKARATAANAAAKRNAAAIKAKSCRQRVWNTNIWYFGTNCCSGCDGRSPAPGGMKGSCTYRWKMGWARSRCQCKATPRGALTFRTNRYYFGTDCCAGCRSAGSQCARRHKGSFATSTCTCKMHC